MVEENKNGKINRWMQLLENFRPMVKNLAILSYFRPRSVWLTVVTVIPIPLNCSQTTPSSIMRGHSSRPHSQGLELCLTI